MDIAAILDIVSQAVSIATKVFPVVETTVANVKVFATQLFQSLNGGTAATADQTAQIEAMVDSLFAQLEEPLPPAQPGDPDYKPTA